MRKALYQLFASGIFSAMLFFSSCDGNTVIPVADFSASDSIINENVKVKFTDLSTNNPDEWIWIFEGGMPAISHEQNPEVTYENSGIYSVTLVATNSAGDSELSKINYIMVVPSTGLIAYYPFDGDFDDNSGNGYDASNNSVDFGPDVSGIENRSAYFHDYGYLEVASNDDLNFGMSDFAVSLWIKSASYSAQMIFQKGGLNEEIDPQYWFRLNDKLGNITFLTGNGTAPSVYTTNFMYFGTDDYWHHIVVQRQGSALQVYLDKVLISETSGEIKNVSSDQSLKFGLQLLNEEDRYPYTGFMDEIRIYKKALSQDEIDVLNALR